MPLPFSGLLLRVVVQDCRAECLFALEVVVERALRHAGTLDDVFYAGAVITRFGEQRDTRFE
jgi:hypothetical protein